MSEYLINASWELIFLKIALYSGHVFFFLCTSFELLQIEVQKDLVDTFYFYLRYFE